MSFKISIKCVGLSIETLSLYLNSIRRFRNSAQIV